ncbi:MAG: hypothetical protein WCW53_09350 [Syntrophales bacterium]
MIFRNIFFAIVLFILLFPISASSEIKEFTKEVEDVVGKDQSQEAKEKYLIERAQRLALEEAGVYISSTTVVTNFQLTEDKVTAMTAGIAKVKMVDSRPRMDDNKNIYIKVKVVVSVDTNILDKQIESLAKETGTMKKLEAEVKRRAALEKELESLKKDDTKRLDQLNAQVIAIEQERQKQRMFREEQALKAKGELNRVQIERLNKEKEQQGRVNKIIAEQEKKRKEEADSISRESDNIKKANLENEQRLSELARRANLKKQEWVAVDESLSIKQIIEESKHIKLEIANISRELDIQFEKNKDNLKNVFDKQIALTVPQLPPNPEPKGDFETTTEYNNRIANHKAKVAEIEAVNQRKIDKLNAELNYEIADATFDYLIQTASIFKDFVNRFNVLQKKTFVLPDEKIEVELGRPNADVFAFPMKLKYENDSIESSLKYSDRSKADDLRKTPQFMRAEGTFKIAEDVSTKYRTQSVLKFFGSLPDMLRGGNKVGSGVAKAKLFQHSDKNDIYKKLVKVKITHPAMDKPQNVDLPEPDKFSELEIYEKIVSESIPEAKNDKYKKRQIVLAFDGKKQSVNGQESSNGQQDKSAKPVKITKKTKKTKKTKIQ